VKEGFRGENTAQPQVRILANNSLLPGEKEGKGRRPCNRNGIKKEKETLAQSLELVGNGKTVQGRREGGGWNQGGAVRERGP